MNQKSLTIKKPALNGEVVNRRKIVFHPNCKCTANLTIHINGDITVHHLVGKKLS